jgi:hypothetical protein
MDRYEKKTFIHFYFFINVLCLYFWWNLLMFSRIQNNFFNISKIILASFVLFFIDAQITEKIENIQFHVLNLTVRN